HSGVELDNGSIIRVQPEIKAEYKYDFAMTINDNRIIMAAYLLQEKGEKVVFVSKDFAARIKAEAIGLEAEEYENLKYSYESVYKGIQQIEMPKHEIDLFYKNGRIDFDLTGKESRPNEYFVMTSPENSSGIGKFDPINKNIEALLKVGNIWGVKPRN